jgi:hypothetical protein
LPAILEVENMKGLFSGVALAALIAVPVWAQAPTNTQNQNAPSGNPPASAQAPAPSQNAPAASQRKEAAGSEKAAPAKSEKSAAAPRQHGEMRMSHMSRHARTMRHGHGMASAHGMRGYGMRSQPISDERRMGWHPHYRMAHHGMYRHYGWYRPHYGWGWGVHAPTDFMAQQLNRQELGQLSGGGMPPSGPPRAGY